MARLLHRRVLLQDYSGPMKFVGQQSVVHSPALLEFAERPWTAVTPVVITPQALAQRLRGAHNLHSLSDHTHPLRGELARA